MGPPTCSPPLLPLFNTNFNEFATILVLVLLGFQRIWKRILNYTLFLHISHTWFLLCSLPLSEFLKGNAQRSSWRFFPARPTLLFPWLILLCIWDVKLLYYVLV